MRITQAYKKATRSSLVQAGARLFAEHGFAETKLDRVAAAVAVAPAHPATRYVDALGSIIVAGYLLYSGWDLGRKGTG